MDEEKEGEGEEDLCFSQTNKAWNETETTDKTHAHAAFSLRALDENIM